MRYTSLFCLIRKVSKRIKKFWWKLPYILRTGLPWATPWHHKFSGQRALDSRKTLIIQRIFKVWWLSKTAGQRWGEWRNVTGRCKSACRFGNKSLGRLVCMRLFPTLLPWPLHSCRARGKHRFGIFSLVTFFGWAKKVINNPDWTRPDLYICIRINQAKI